MDEAPLWFQAYQAQSLLRHNELTARLNNLENDVAVTYNRMSLRAHEAIKPLRGVNGIVPPNFPATREELFQLSQAQCALLLRAYNIDDGGNTILAKRNRLAVHIGLIL